jgi:hypothetical protein
LIRAPGDGTLTQGCVGEQSGEMSFAIAGSLP